MTKEENINCIKIKVSRIIGRFIVELLTMLVLSIISWMIRMLVLQDITINSIDYFVKGVVYICWIYALIQSEIIMLSNKKKLKYIFPLLIANLWLLTTPMCEFVCTDDFFEYFAMQAHPVFLLFIIGYRLIYNSFLFTVFYVIIVVIGQFFYLIWLDNVSTKIYFYLENHFLSYIEKS